MRSLASPPSLDEAGSHNSEETKGPSEVKVAFGFLFLILELGMFLLGKGCEEQQRKLLKMSRGALVIKR